MMKNDLFFIKIKFFNKMANTSPETVSSLGMDSTTQAQNFQPLDLSSIIEETITNIDYTPNNTVVSDIIKLIYDNVIDIQTKRNLNDAAIDEIFEKIIDIYGVQIISQIEFEIQSKVNTEDKDIQSAIAEVQSQYPYLQSKSSDKFKNELNTALSVLPAKDAVDKMALSYLNYNIATDANDQILDYNL